MPVRIMIPGPFRRLAGGASEAEVEAATVYEAIRALETLAPGLRDRLTTGDGGIRRFIRLYVNGKDIFELNGAETELRDGDSIEIVPAAAGG